MRREKTLFLPFASRPHTRKETRIRHPNTESCIFIAMEKSVGCSKCRCYDPIKKLLSNADSQAGLKMKRFALFVVCVLTVTGFKIVSHGQKKAAISLLSRIDDARLKLKDETVKMVEGIVGTRKVRVSRRRYQEIPVMGIVGREMALAVMDMEGKIHLIRAIKRDNGFEVITQGFVIYARQNNGINTDFACVNPPGGRILAVKYPVSNEAYRFGPGPSVIEAVYTPYSAEIKTEEVVGKGLEVQAELIGKAYARLKEKQVYSRALPGKRIVDAIPRDVLAELLINEHIDPTEFKGAANAAGLVERVLTVIGTNRENAYAYSISPAGARGLVQMMPSVYARIAGLYPAAGLMPDFARGMRDATNAIMAQMLLCDSDWEAIRSVNDIPRERIGPYLAAAYNGGVGRVISVLNHDGTDWMEDPHADGQPMMRVTKKVPVKVRSRQGRARTVYVNRTYSQPIFRYETNKYVRQYHWIEAYMTSRRGKPAKPALDEARD